MIIWEDRNLPSWPWRKGCNNFAIFLQCLTPMWPSRLPHSNKWFNTLRKILHQQGNCLESVRAPPRPNCPLKINLIWYESRCWLLSIVWWPVMSSPTSSSRLVTVAGAPWDMVSEPYQVLAYTLTLSQPGGSRLWPPYTAVPTKFLEYT